MDTSYAIYIYNHMLNAEDIVPDDIFNITKFTYHNLKDIHIWGYPAIFFLILNYHFLVSRAGY